MPFGEYCVRPLVRCTAVVIVVGGGGGTLGIRAGGGGFVSELR